MAELNLAKSKTALLMADFATIGIGENPIAQERHTLFRLFFFAYAARSKPLSYKRIGVVRVIPAFIHFEDGDAPQRRQLFVIIFPHLRPPRRSDTTVANQGVFRCP